MILIECLQQQLIILTWEIYDGVVHTNAATGGVVQKLSDHILFLGVNVERQGFVSGKKHSFQTQGRKTQADFLNQEPYTNEIRTCNIVINQLRWI